MLQVTKSQWALNEVRGSFLEELKARVDASGSRFDNWKRLLNETNTAENLAFKEENSKLKHDVSQASVDTPHCFLFLLQRI